VVCHNSAVITSQGAGLYLATYTATIAGTYTLVVSGVSPSAGVIYGSPFSVLVSPSSAVAANCVATGTGKSSGTSGSLATFYVQLKDSSSNNLVVTHKI
jgi:hypothetical protein